MAQAKLIELVADDFSWTSCQEDPFAEPTASFTLTGSVNALSMNARVGQIKFNLLALPWNAESGQLSPPGGDLTVRANRVIY